jgi:hypothetical protein
MKTKQLKIIVWITNQFHDKETQQRIAVIHRYSQMLQSQLRRGKFNYENIIKSH